MTDALNIRNPRYNAHGTVDVEYDHPDLGWIPFTADPDGLLLEQEIYDLAQQGEVASYQGETVSSGQVNLERQRRIAVGKVIDGVHVTGSDEDARNLMSLALGAQMRLAAGDTETVTTFRDGGNFDHDLTPAQLLSLWQQSAAYVSDLYAASWALKAMEPIPADYANDSYWPEGGTA